MKRPKKKRRALRRGPFPYQNLWLELFRVLAEPKLRHDIAEGSNDLPREGWGRIKSAPWIRERYATVCLGKSRLFVAWGRYHRPEDDGIYARHWYGVPKYLPELP